MIKLYLSPIFIFTLLFSCQSKKTDELPKESVISNPKMEYKAYEKKATDMVISREKYFDQLYGFWLGQCIANWTGLVTEMDKVGNIGDLKSGDFYGPDDWGKPDLPNIWSENPSDLSPTIDFVLRGENEVWGADDDTDIEYIYQHLLKTHQTSLLTGAQIREGWLKHIKLEEENYLWVSNQKVLDLMKEGVIPPATSDPDKNEHYEMIDAQLTTEIFGFYAPARPDFALEMASLPIRTSAGGEAAWIAEFYVIMYSLASKADVGLPMKERMEWMAEEARKRLPEDSYAAKMYEYVKGKYEEGLPWAQTRDSVYVRYQVEQMDGYDITSQNLPCNGCFAAGINYAASLVSLFYGEGDFKETVKIGTLAGWDSDNPTATWGGLIGFMIGKEGIEKAFNSRFSNKFNIHRTRQNFPGNGIDNFEQIAEDGVFIVDRVVQENLGGGVDLENNVWYIPEMSTEIRPL